jgi:hypothetical protein
VKLKESVYNRLERKTEKQRVCMARHLSVTGCVFRPGLWFAYEKGGKILPEIVRQ